MICPTVLDVADLKLRNLPDELLDIVDLDAGRAVARELIGGGGGCIFIYSCYARRISFEISCF